MYYQKTNLTETLKTVKTGESDLISYINTLCDRIDAVDPIVQSLIPESGRRERLLQEAERLLALYPDTGKRPPLFGIPVGIKDIFRVDGMPTSCGSKLPPELFNGTEATLVTRLKNAGALILGKTVTTEFAYFDPGPTRNPNHTGYTPGGSSSGSAAAVAAGLTPLAFGTQTIGSIIRPAAYCGVVGVKPSTKSISAAGVIPFSPTLDHVGFFCHTLDDASLVAGLLCPDEHLYCKDQTAGLTLAIPHKNYLAQADEEVTAHFYKCVASLHKKGFKIMETLLFDEIQTINTLHRKLAAYEFAITHQTWYANYAHLYSPHATQLIEDGIRISAAEVREILSFRENLTQKVNQFTDDSGIDIWISPPVMTMPLQGLSSTGSPLMNLPWTFTGLPSVTFPTERNKNNLPYGLQCCSRSQALHALLQNANVLFKALHPLS